MSESLRRRIAQLSSQLELLPEAEEPPPTTLQVIGRSQQEQDWQRLLFHYLSPDAAHGLDYDLLEHFLTALADRGDLSFSFSRFDLNDVQIAREVTTSDDRRPDAVIWSGEDWFICWELKVSASEGEDQTPDYIEADSFRSIGLDKSDVPSGGHHYVYLAPEDASSPDADEFVPISWEWVASEIQSFLADSHGGHPARTTAQLNEFIGLIQSELTMTDYQEGQQEKVNLYIDHYDEIAEVQQAFEDEWTEFERDWGTRLAKSLESAEIVDQPDMPEQYVAVELEMDDGERKQWAFRQGNSDWAWMVPRGWWTKLDEDRPTYDTSKPNARVGFLHRLDRNKDDALADHNLIFYLRNAPSGHDDFYNGFASRFNSDDEIPELLPAGTSRPGVKSNVLEATYDINVEFHDGFFEAYVAALTRAIEDHAVSNPALVYKIDTLYSETIDEDTSV
ncbi:PD-(D/E)XK nuclease family protein [Halogeometricum borinquense]|uniref:PD-(D/E)XK nuclease family protein n=1 Tax=Halogeometricum borinquense TaxID=60847 RepID=A0A6C0UK46_9EURY|nr:PD-(D/E)XK nuclease family protein [Halogeometricum borinquense]QIB74973.1 PD-(D/E)XK nuclease family protein [Halogeometricum borinquense]